ncbi:MAG: 4Fe-4S binding protein, partial [Alphaproteobacteria bacterium]|nr:4Fe-4S binding protein [Alphaproteobacteria bacterium]
LPVFIGGEKVGYIFSTMDTVNAGGYSGVPFDLIAGFTLDGDITGAFLLDHHEPIIGKPVPETLLTDFVAGFGIATLDTTSDIKPDTVKGATISARLIRNGMVDAARLVYGGQVMGLNAPVTEPELDRTGFRPYTFAEMIENKSVLNYTVTNAQIVEMFDDQVGDGALPDESIVGRDAAFTNMYIGLVTAPSIGVNVFGDRRYEGYMGNQADNGLAIWVAGNGEFSWMGNAFQRSASNYTFDRVKFVQGALEIPLTREMFKRASGLNNSDVPNVFQSLIFFLPADSGVDPLLPFDLVMTVPGKAADGTAASVTFPITYQLPERHMLLPPPPPIPAWVEAWTDKRTEIAILFGMLFVLSLIFLLQDYLVRNRRVYTYVRVAFLAMTLGWLGYYAGGQLSVVNIMAYAQAPFAGAKWSSFLLDPILFIVSVYVALTLFILGRGVFCGWLCPFGALQEFINKVARFIKIPQLKINRTLQERLWAVKYIAAVVVVGLVFISVEMAGTASEMEPFKTAISANFMRAWPFVLYTGILLFVGIFVERAFCRFLCPLGGTLGILGRIHMFTWLKRRPQCGTQCRICESDCPMGAIESSGKINMNECLQCLDCQVDYYDNHTCPPLIQRRKRKETRKAAAKPKVAPIPDGPLIPGAAPAE